jgi:hypothetical protein
MRSARGEKGRNPTPLRIRPDLLRFRLSLAVAILFGRIGRLLRIFLRVSGLSLPTVTVIGAVAAIPKVAATVEFLVRRTAMEPVAFIPMGRTVSRRENQGEKNNDQEEADFFHPLSFKTLLPTAADRFQKAPVGWNILKLLVFYSLLLYNNAKFPPC